MVFKQNVDALQIDGVEVIVGVGVGVWVVGVGLGVSGAFKHVMQSPKSGVPKSGPPGPPNWTNE